MFLPGDPSDKPAPQRRNAKGRSNRKNIIYQIYDICSYIFWNISLAAVN